MSEQGCMPVGEWIEVYDDFGYVWRLIRPLAIGKEYVFAENADTDDITLPKTYKWRYPINHEQQKRDDIMEAWRRMSIDFAHDTEKSMAHAGTFIDMLIKKGFVEVEK